MYLNVWSTTHMMMGTIVAIPKADRGDLIVRGRARGPGGGGYGPISEFLRAYRKQLNPQKIKQFHAFSYREAAYKTRSSRMAAQFAHRMRCSFWYGEGAFSGSWKWKTHVISLRIFLTLKRDGKSLISNLV